MLPGRGRRKTLCRPLFHVQRTIFQPRAASARWSSFHSHPNIAGVGYCHFGSFIMNRVATTVAIAAAFAAGCNVTYLLRPAIATETLTAQIIHTGDLDGDALGPANADGMHSKMFVSAAGAT